MLTTHDISPIYTPNFRNNYLVTKMEFHGISGKDKNNPNNNVQSQSRSRVPSCMKKVKSDCLPSKIGECHEKREYHTRKLAHNKDCNETGDRLKFGTAQPITNRLVNPCFTPEGMSTEPLKFPNLVTGFNRNPIYAAKSALSTRYTLFEWNKNQTLLLDEAYTNTGNTGKLRKDTVCLMRTADDRVQEGQKETGLKLDEKIRDTLHWRNEVASELEHLLMENKRMEDFYNIFSEFILNLEAPLHIAQECLHLRESRKGCELVHDEPEQALLEEIQTIRNCQKKLEQFIEKCRNQLKNGKRTQNDLKQDLSNKSLALYIDESCHRLKNHSNGLQYLNRIEKYNNLSVFDAEAWVQYSENIVKKSQLERARSCQLRNEIEHVMNSVSEEICNAWDSSNNAIVMRSAQVIDAKDKVQIHLHKIHQEIFNVEKNIQLIKKAIMDKSAALKVAHTRLKGRSYRPQAEMSADYAHLSIVKEVETINRFINEMQEKLKLNESQRQHLLKTRNNLGFDFKAKVDSLFLDKEKCMGMRRSFPITSIVKN